MILFTAPKSSAGQGYLRIDKNLWFYDPSVGKWERRTERERIGGTNSRRSDFDESRLAEEYDPTDEGEEKLGVYTAQKLKLTGKPGQDLAFPIVHIWIDKDDARTSSSGRSTRCRGGSCGRRTTRSGRRSTARRRRATSGTRRRSASTTRWRRPTRRWCSSSRSTPTRCRRTSSRRPGWRARVDEALAAAAVGRRAADASVSRPPRRRRIDRASRTSSAAALHADADAVARRAGARPTTAPPSPVTGAPGPPSPAVSAPPAAAPASEAAGGTARDQELLSGGNDAKFLSDYVAPGEPAADRRPALSAHADHRLGRAGPGRLVALRRPACSTSTSTRARIRACAPSSSAA